MAVELYAKTTWIDQIGLLCFAETSVSFRVSTLAFWNVFTIVLSALAGTARSPLDCSGAERA